MARPIFAYTNKVDAATLSGGDWRTTLPLENLQDRRLERVARSETDATADAQFVVDLGSSEYVRCAGVFKHNLSLDGLVRIRGYDVAETWLYDSDWFNPFTIYPSGVLQTGHPAAGTTELAQADYDAGYRVDIVKAFSEVEARFWSFEFDDTTNPDGYIELGRAWVDYGYQPSHGVSVGMRFGYETRSTREESEGEASFFDERPRRRIIDFQLEQFTDDEVLVYPHELNRRVGTTHQMLFIADPDATVHMHRWSYLGTLKELRPLVFSRSMYTDVGFTFLEEL